jgi:hypothetical protein
MTISKLDTRIGSRRAPFIVGSLITFVRLNSERISNNLLLFSRNKSIFVDNDIIIDGFSDQILRKDRNCFGGGVLVYTSKDICVKPGYDLNCCFHVINQYSNHHL